MFSQSREASPDSVYKTGLRISLEIGSHLNSENPVVRVPENGSGST